MRSLKPIDEPTCNPSDNPTLQALIASRRDFLKAGGALAALNFLGGLLPFAPTTRSSVAASSPLLAGLGPSIPTHTDDRVTVMPGFKLQAILPWGDPLTQPQRTFKPDGTNSAADQATQIGDNHDGMHYFPLPAKKDEGVLALNHEYTNYEYLFGAEYTTPWTVEKAEKAIAAHGVSIVHLKRHANGKWETVSSHFNRRITGNTPCEITGPAAGHPLLQTKADPTGRRVLGTLNNCANGATPWGTYLTCEENFNFYFGNGDEKNPMHKRYGLTKEGQGYRWHEVIDRFDLAKEPNEANRFGWVVEIDPFDPNSTPKKRTALGRFKHENAAIAIAPDGRVVVYMGDDERFEYLYKFVSRGRYQPNNPSANRNLLDEGDLYVAQFTATEAGNQRFVGRWVLLSKEQTPQLRDNPAFGSQAEVLIYTRAAADAVGATKMDRPEWIAIHPQTGEVYVTLTNNSRRTADQVDAANPRAENRWGHIIRWREANGDPTASEFAWDFFVVCGNPNLYPRTDARSGSPNITVENMFNSPDGLAFDAKGRLWIQSDGNFSNGGPFAGMGNNQMLVADPTSGEIRRFLVGPSGCEITGVAFTPDGRTMFINVQHPGEAEHHPRQPQVAQGTDLNAYIASNPTSFSNWPHSQFPEIAGGRPRSATIVIEREDGQPFWA